MDSVNRNHVFISYSRRNSEFAKTLIAELERWHIPFWIDRSGVQHQSASFEREIRKALSTAFAVILIATPDSLASDYVQGEVDIADPQNIPLFVLWADGDHFTDTVPTRLSRRSYIDCRNDKYDAGFKQLIEELLPLRDRAIPAMSVRSDGVPSCCYAIDLPSGLRISARVGAHETLVDMLLELYNSFLASVFSPFTYGTEWVLTLGTGHFVRAVCPVELISAPKEAEWYFAKPNELGIKQGVSVVVQPMKQSGLFVLLLKPDARVRPLMDRLDKPVTISESAQPSDITISKFVYRMVHRENAILENVPEPDNTYRRYVLCGNLPYLHGKAVIGRM